MRALFVNPTASGEGRWHTEKIDDAKRLYEVLHEYTSDNRKAAMDQMGETWLLWGILRDEEDTIAMAAYIEPRLK